MELTEYVLLVLACGRGWGWLIINQVCWCFALVRVWWLQSASHVPDFTSVLLCWLSHLQGPRRAGWLPQFALYCLPLTEMKLEVGAQKALLSRKDFSVISSLRMGLELERPVFLSSCFESVSPGLVQVRRADSDDHLPPNHGWKRGPAILWGPCRGCRSHRWPKLKCQKLSWELPLPKSWNTSG